MTSVERLFVIWRAPPGNGTRHLVGELGGPAPYWFRYADDLEGAFKDGFAGFPEFPLTDARYESARLFATFEQRIPSRRRPDLPRLLASWGLEAQDTPPLALLARSGGFLLTDRIELAEYRPEHDDLTCPLRFRIAGQKYYDDPGAALPVGIAVAFRCEPTNQHDPVAVEILSEHGKIGYVPRQYAAMFTRLLASNVPVVAETVAWLLVPGEQRRWVVEARRGLSVDVRSGVAHT